MKNAKHLFVCALALTISLPFYSSCSKSLLEENGEDTENSTEKISLVFHLYTPTSSRATSVADFKKIWIMDIIDGNVQQIVAQDANTSPQFGSPTLQLVKGKHTLHFFATDAPVATLDEMTISQHPLGDSFFKSIKINTQEVEAEQRVVLERQVAKVQYTGEESAQIQGVLSTFHLKSGTPQAPAQDVTLKQGESLLTYVPTSGYLTLPSGKKIPVKKNSITLIESKGEEDNGGGNEGGNEGGGGETPTPPSADEVLILETDTACFYVGKKEIAVTSLTDYPNPMETFAPQMKPYRMPTRLEALSLNKKKLSSNYWSGIRCLCYDSPYNSNNDVSGKPIGSGDYYTFKWGESGVLLAGFKTAYCIKGIRTVSIAPISLPHHIDADFAWNTDTTFVK